MIAASVMKGLMIKEKGIVHLTEEIRTIKTDIDFTDDQQFNVMFQQLQRNTFVDDGNMQMTPNKF